MPTKPATHKPPKVNAPRLRRHDGRASAAARGYDNRWHRVRNWYIKRNPLCAWCKGDGRTSAATVVDHIVPIRQGGPRLNTMNLQSLCDACHARKTALDGSRDRGR